MLSSWPQLPFSPLSLLLPSPLLYTSPLPSPPLSSPPFWSNPFWKNPHRHTQVYALLTSYTRLNSIKLKIVINHQGWVWVAHAL
jgi:hypothetical protein